MSPTPKRILIVDDDPQVYKMLETVLTPKNYILAYAADGMSAWDQIRKEPPHLIVLDIMMPEMSGIELCQKIRNEPACTNTLILMLSAKDTQSDRLQGLRYGADDYVTKPFHVSTLVHKIEYMLTKQKE